MLTVLETTQKACPWDPKKTTVEDTHRGIDKANAVFTSLLRTIVYQQLSDKSARAIHTRVVALFNALPTPEETMALSFEQFRGAGLSERKTEYIKSLATAFIEKSLDPTKFEAMSDEEIIEKMTKIKGIGVWSAQMYLMFELKRCDVFPAGDLAIRKATAAHFSHLPQIQNSSLLAKLKKGQGGKGAEELLCKVTEEYWAPYRSLASWAMWQSLDLTNVEEKQEKLLERV